MMRIHSVLCSIALVGVYVVGCSGDSERDGSGGSAGAGVGGSAGSGVGGSAGSGAAGASGSGGGTPDGGTPDGGSTNWDAYCADAAAQHASCGMSFECQTAACIYSIYDPGIVDEYASCLLQRSCNDLGSDDDCFGAAGMVNGQLPPADQPAWDACVDKNMECSKGSDPFNLDSCSLLAPLILQKHSDAAELCFAKPCAEIPTCISAITAQFDCLDD